MTGQELTDLMKQEADKPTNRLIERLLAEGAEWIEDPQVAGVYGLRPAHPLPGDEVTSGPARVVVIVYTADPTAFVPRPYHDFEVSGSFEDAMFATRKGSKR